MALAFCKSITERKIIDSIFNLLIEGVLIYSLNHWGKKTFEPCSKLITYIVLAIEILSFIVVNLVLSCTNIDIATIYKWMYVIVLGLGVILYGMACITRNWYEKSKTLIVELVSYSLVWSAIYCTSEEYLIEGIKNIIGCFNLLITLILDGGLWVAIWVWVTICIPSTAEEKNAYICLTLF